MSTSNPQRRFRLDGRTVLITGATTGIGFAIAEAFAEQGAQVIIADIDAGADEDAAASLHAAGCAAQHVAYDVTQLESMDVALQVMDDRGLAVDVLANNAGVIHAGSILKTELADLQRVFRVNVEGVFNVTRAFLPEMIRRGGGVILNMASLAALTAIHDRFAYAASKLAVMMMTRSIVLTFGNDTIRAHYIILARIYTSMIEEYFEIHYTDCQEETFNTFSEYQPIGRMIRPDEVACMAVYLCSDEASMVTGTAFPIDGDALMGV